MLEIILGGLSKSPYIISRPPHTHPAQVIVYLIILAKIIWQSDSTSQIILQGWEYHIVDT